MDESLSNLDARLRTVMCAELRHHVRVGDTLIAAKVGPDGGREMDSTVSLTFDQAKLHISTARLVKGAAEMAFSFATAATMLLPLDQAQVFFGGIFSGPKLSHPEGVAMGPNGWIWVGNQDGDICRITPDGARIERVASTVGFILGLAFDGDRALFACT